MDQLLQHLQKEREDLHIASSSDRAEALTVLYGIYCLPECEAMYSGRNLIFHKNSLCASLRQKIK
jgi:hypothetical protein